MQQRHIGNLGEACHAGLHHGFPQRVATSDMQEQGSQQRVLVAHGGHVEAEERGCREAAQNGADHADGQIAQEGAAAGSQEPAAGEATQKADGDPHQNAHALRTTSETTMLT